MHNLLVSIFGEYVPITYVSEGVEIIPSGLSGVNFEYVLGALIFLVAFYSFFRILGSLIGR